MILINHDTIKLQEIAGYDADGDALASVRDVRKVICDAPAVAAAPVVTAVWRHIGGDEWLCTACCNVISTEGSWEHPYQKYCDQCGAKITGVEIE